MRNVPRTPPLIHPLRQPPDKTNAMRVGIPMFCMHVPIAGSAVAGALHSLYATPSIETHFYCSCRNLLSKHRLLLID